MQQELIQSFQSYLDKLEITALNEMQLATVEAVVNHPNIVLQAPTGSGKTLAFLLPMLPKLDASARKVQALIVCPSRELVLQTENVFRSLGTGLKVTACYGGHKREIEEKSLVEAPALIIATPGRLCDHLRRENIDPTTIQMLVMDEYDKCLELGFEEEMAFILEKLTNLSQKMLISATSTGKTANVWKSETPHILDFSTFKIEKHEADELVEYQLISEDKDKKDILFQLLCHINTKPAIVFLNHRDAVERTYNAMKEMGLFPVFYHGGMEQHDREVALSKFRNGTATILITTDLAGRGLDMPGLRYIIHYHLPDTQETLTHRNGRTARMFEGGKAVYIIGPEEKLPAFIDASGFDTMDLPEEIELPEKPRWTTLFFDAGKKNKLNKIDIVGFLHQQARLKSEDIGLIEVKDFYSFAAVRKNQANVVIERIQSEKIKGKKVKIAIAK